MNIKRSCIFLCLISMSASLFGTAGCRRERGLPSAADGGKQSVSPDQKPSSSATDPATGTESAGKPSGPSGGTTGTDATLNQNRAGAGGGPTAATAGQSPKPDDAMKK